MLLSHEARKTTGIVHRPHLGNEQTVIVSGLNSVCWILLILHILSDRTVVIGVTSPTERIEAKPGINETDLGLSIRVVKEEISLLYHDGGGLSRTEPLDGE